MYAVYFNLTNKNMHFGTLIEIISSYYNGLEHVIKLTNPDHIYFWIYLVTDENQLTRPLSLKVDHAGGFYEIRIVSAPSEAFIYYRYDRVAFRATKQIKPVTHYV